jgi:hypothetical protein
LRIDGDAALREASISLTRVPGIEHDAVADDAELAGRTTPDGRSASL